MRYYTIYKHFIALLTVSIFVSCQQNKTLNRIEGQRIEINDSLATDSAIEAFVKPYRERVNSDLDSVLAFAVDTYSKTDGELNTAIGNYMADVVLEQANPIYLSRTGNRIDFVLLNHGGIRAIISKGNVTTRTAYEVMPFENSIVVSEMSGQLILDELIPYLINAKRAHPISNLQLHIDANANIKNVAVGGQPIDPKKVYHVATSDYLYFGGDRMHFFKKGDSLHVLDYKIRNALIDNFIKIDTLNPVIDDRFLIIE